MNRKGNCYDNAPMECAFSTLKNELVRHRQFQNQAETRYAIAEYIERFFNHQRLHQAPGYRSPEEFEKMAGVRHLIAQISPNQLDSRPAKR